MTNEELNEQGDFKLIHNNECNELCKAICIDVPFLIISLIRKRDEILLTIKPGNKYYFFWIVYFINFS
jgi:hypothetical protein